MFSDVKQKRKKEPQKLPSCKPNAKQCKPLCTFRFSTALSNYLIINIHSIYYLYYSFLPPYISMKFFIHTYK
uniref:Uncharacterized protein n=1 Tax=Myoviridae sp. ct9MV2 TaxID=2826625 RepID=A0A8S5NCG7_9CAUD|nr:MAG TPA: hypothetical protein [Myoviridae sp. ct9MV2]